MSVKNYRVISGKDKGRTFGIERLEAPRFIILKAGYGTVVPAGEFILYEQGSVDLFMGSDLKLLKEGIGQGVIEEIKCK